MVPRIKLCGLRARAAKWKAARETKWESRGSLGIQSCRSQWTRSRHGCERINIRIRAESIVWKVHLLKLLPKLCPLTVLLAGIVITGCSTKHYRESADAEAYFALRQKTPLVTNMDTHFTIEQSNVLVLDGLPIITNVSEFLGEYGGRENGAAILDLQGALEVGVHHSRSYQSRKEQLYLSALSLTLARHQFAPIFSASANGNYAAATAEGVDAITGLPTGAYEEAQKVTADGSVGASWLIRDVGRITTALTADFLRFVVGDPRLATSSKLEATFLRPILQDAGFKAEQEALTQSERQLLYDLRSFTQFRKDFSVQIATAYYGALGSRDAARNSYLALQSSKKNAERGRAMAQEGRITQSELGRLEQSELSSESSWIGALRSYADSLDNFKIQLGLSVDAHIVLDDRELEALQIHHPNLNVEDSIRVALVARLDYLNLKDQFDDSVRKVDLAANFLLPRLDATAGAAILSNPNTGNEFRAPDPRLYTWNAGLSLDPGLDRKAERNDYRASLIARNSSARALEQLEDQIKFQVRDGWRSLEQAKRNYEINEIGVKLAERRVEEQNLLADLGRAKAQDQVDAQNDFISSKNQRTQALVSHTIARLQFWNNMGILYIRDNGQWEEVQGESH
jgi:outer membrane protein TolC